MADPSMCEFHVERALAIPLADGTLRERIQVAVRSTSHRRSSVIEASVVRDGTTLLHRQWAGGDPGPSPGTPNP
jgi:hypothetical protein